MSAVEQELSQVRAEWAVVQQTPLIQARLLNALRDTQLEQGHLLAQHSRQLEQHSVILAQHSLILDEHSRVLDEHGHGIHQIISMLTVLIEREHPS